MKIYLGPRNESSWSLRPWLALKHVGAPFEEEIVRLDLPSSRERLAAVSPSGRVPVLEDDRVRIWDSLAICEYLAEKFPEAKLWPEDPALRATARSVSAEMHSSFQCMREQLVMKFAEAKPQPELRPITRSDLQRIQKIWNTCRAQHSSRGEFLFGAFSIADAMFAPVVSRFRTYGIELEGAAAGYAEFIWSTPAMQEWLKLATAEVAARSNPTAGEEKR